MEKINNTQQISPPRLIPSITAGFNIIANNIQLILFPIILDLLLWFGPHIKIKKLLEPFVTTMLDPLSTLPADTGNITDIKVMIQAAYELWQIILDRYNVMTALRAFPFGVPSLFGASSPLNNPINYTNFHELSSIYSAIGLWILLFFIGLIIGGIFFNEISRNIIQPTPSFSIRKVIWQIAQIIGLTIALILILALISVPISIFITLIAIINPFIAQLGIILISFLLLWLFLPLIFSAHGIFIQRQNFLFSMLTSARFVRYTFPTTGMFILICLLINQGLDTLWRMPSETSWMALVGVAGHAFISTSLLAASFVYYRDGVFWLLETLRTRYNQNGIKDKA